MKNNKREGGEEEERLGDEKEPNKVINGTSESCDCCCAYNIKRTGTWKLLHLILHLGATELDSVVVFSVLPTIIDQHPTQFVPADRRFLFNVNVCCMMLSPEFSENITSGASLFLLFMVSCCKEFTCMLQQPQMSSFTCYQVYKCSPLPHSHIGLDPFIVAHTPIYYTPSF